MRGLQGARIFARKQDADSYSKSEQGWETVEASLVLRG